MRIKYIGPHDAVEVSGHQFNQGGEGEVPADLGNRLLEQKSTWVAAPAPTKKKGDA